MISFYFYSLLLKDVPRGFSSGWNTANDGHLLIIIYRFSRSNIRSDLKLF